MPLLKLRCKKCETVGVVGDMSYNRCITFDSNGEFVFAVGVLLLKLKYVPYDRCPGLLIFMVTSHIRVDFHYA